MFKLFLKHDNMIKYPIRIYGKFNYLGKKYTNELRKIKDYYRNKEHAVNNKHILTRLVNTLTATPSLNIYEYLRIVSASSKLTSKQFNITSNINKGIVHDNELFGRNSKEVFLYCDSVIDIDHFVENWKEYKPLKVIRNENTDLNMDMPDTNNEYVLPTLSVTTIDINILMLQYRMWVIDRMAFSQVVDTNTFISQIVLPNMLDNILDLAVYNRMIKIMNGEEINQFKNKYPFLITDYSIGVDKTLRGVLRDNTNKGMDIVHLLKTIPCIIADDMYEALYIPHKYYTKQSEWVLWLSRISVVNDIIKILGARGVRKNSHDLNKLPIFLKDMERSNTIENLLSDFLDIDFQYEVDILKKKIGKR